MTQDMTQALPVGDFTILTPSDWYRIPLGDPDRRVRSVNALVERQFKGVDDQPVLKRETAATLTGAAQEAADNGGLVLYVSTQRILDVPLPASLLVTLMPSVGDALDAARALASGSGEIGLRDLAAGRSVRARRESRSKESAQLGSTLTDTLLQYYIPVPGEPEMLLLSFGTPLEPLADAMVELFDAVAESVRRPAQNGGDA